MHLLEYQIILGIIATIIGVVCFIPYFNGIIKKKVKPHAFSWLIWGIIQTTVFFAQISKGGGAGAWRNGVGAILILTIFVIAIFRGEKEITKLDKICLISALFGIVLWLITTNPVWSVIIVSVADAIGYLPTMRKSYKNPYQESATIFGLSAISLFISLFALGSINITTVLYPISIGIADTLLVILIIAKRRTIKESKSANGKK